MSYKQEIYIHNATHTVEGNTHCIRVSVDDEDLWFECSDVELSPKIEGFVSALLLPAMIFHADIIVEGTLSEKWVQNAGVLMRIFQKWWGYQPVRIRSTHRFEHRPTASGRGIALFYSGGVDSMFNLIRLNHMIDYLVYVQGYDNSITDQEKSTKLEEWHRETAALMGKKYIKMRTNYRLHPINCGVSWEQAHGGALAAAGHFIDTTCHLAIISSSFPYAFNHPWGTHWDTDPYWSDDSIQFQHSGAEYWRTEKLQQICNHTIVAKYLRVCFSKTSRELNCCRCEKCVRTMLILHQSGVLDTCHSFKSTNNLHIAVKELHFVKKPLIPVYRAFLRHNQDERIRQELKKLVTRSRKRSSSTRGFFTKCMKNLYHRMPKPVFKFVKLVVPVKIAHSIKARFDLK